MFWMTDKTDSDAFREIMNRSGIQYGIAQTSGENPKTTVSVIDPDSSRCLLFNFGPSEMGEKLVSVNIVQWPPPNEERQAPRFSRPPVIPPESYLYDEFVWRRKDTISAIGILIISIIAMIILLYPAK